MFIYLSFRALIAGGGAPETELSIRLREHADTLLGMQQYCFRAYADALEVVPFTLAENAGLNPIATVTELRNRHANSEIHTGINVRKVSHVYMILEAAINIIHIYHNTVNVVFCML